MTHREQQLLAFIREYQARHHGVTPSYQEMAEHLGLKGKSGAHRLVVALERKGKIRRTPHEARSIILTNVGATPNAMSSERAALFYVRSILTSMAHGHIGKAEGFRDAMKAIEDGLGEETK